MRLLLAAWIVLDGFPISASKWYNEGKNRNQAPEVSQVLIRILNFVLVLSEVHGSAASAIRPCREHAVKKQWHQGTTSTLPVMPRWG